MTSTRTDLSRLHITCWGDRGPRVILVHGGVQGSATGGELNFSNQKRLADEGWRLVVPDRPGHGGSPDPGRPDDAEADGAWVAELLGEGAHLVGHSFGGCVALAAAARRPEAVRSLTLIEPAMHKLAIGDRRVKSFLLRMVGVQLSSFSSATRARRAMTLLGIPPEIRDRANPDELRRMGLALRRAALPSRATLVRELSVVRDWGIPLLVVTGGWSGAFDATARHVAASGGGRHVVVPAPHHFCQLVSEGFNQAWRDFAEHGEARTA